MSVQVFPPHPIVRVSINSTAIGAAKYFRVQCSAEPITVRAFGRSAPEAIVLGKQSYVITLKRLIVDRIAFPDEFRAHEIDNFTLTLDDGSLQTVFSGCHITQELTSFDDGRILVEELTVHAAARKHYIVL